MPEPDDASPTRAETLTLSPALGEGGAEVADCFVGHSPPERRARVFGGQVVAQSFRAGCELAPDLHAAGVAYATDHGPFGAARRIVDTAGAGLFDGVFRPSLDHAIWFHRPPRIDDRVLYDIEAVTHRSDRILPSGRIVDGAGRRIATVAQEILARAPRAC